MKTTKQAVLKQIKPEQIINFLPNQLSVNPDLTNQLFKQISAWIKQYQLIVYNQEQHPLFAYQINFFQNLKAMLDEHKSAHLIIITKFTNETDWKIYEIKNDNEIDYYSSTDTWFKKQLLAMFNTYIPSVNFQADMIDNNWVVYDPKRIEHTMLIFKNIDFNQAIKGSEFDGALLEEPLGRIFNGMSHAIGATHLNEKLLYIDQYQLYDITKDLRAGDAFIKSALYVLKLKNLIDKETNCIVSYSDFDDKDFYIEIGNESFEIGHKKIRDLMINRQLGQLVNLIKSNLRAFKNEFKHHLIQHRY